MARDYLSTALRPPARRTRPPMAHAEVERHREDLIAILREVAALSSDTETPPGPLAHAQLRRVLRKYPKDGSGFFARSQLIAGLRAFGREAGVASREPELLERLRFRPTRTQSGVVPVTVLTKPFPCPGQCVYCPNDVRMPKAYLSDEPGAQRAEDNGFDPYAQTLNRLLSFDATGHPTDKIELIILGGTWSFYPESYQCWFVQRCLEALNDFKQGVSPGDQEIKGESFDALPRHVDGRSLSENYNQQVGRHLRAVHAGELLSSSQQSTWEALTRAQQQNEYAQVRCVGLSVETRPDHIDAAEVLRMRRLGVTKVQLGVQSLDDRVLEKIKRGHDVAATRAAFAQLRRGGFKVHAHWMPNLLGATPESDRQDFERLFSDPAIYPDELKIYPCSLIESAELMRFYESGEWAPYDETTLCELLADLLPRTPRTTRLPRVIRDIPSTDIVVGNLKGNLREAAERLIRERGHKLVEIRSRELRQTPLDSTTLELKETRYATTVSEEVFLEWVDAQDRIAAFVRLSLPTGPPLIAELSDCTILREVHVYGRSLELGVRTEQGAQHRGLGRSLIAKAEALSYAAGFSKLAVISAIGTRPYYRGLGFEDAELYQIKSL